MGASNVIAAYALYAGRVPATSMQLLAYMACISKDDDKKPWYGQGHAALAEHALGRSAPITRADIKAVERAIAPLAEKGAITTDRKAAVRSDGPNTVRYRLHLKTPHVPQKPGDDTEAQDPPRPPKSGPHVPRNSSPRPPENGLTSPEDRVTEEPGGDRRSEKTEEEEIAVRTGLEVARAREAAEEPISLPDTTAADPMPPALHVILGNPDVLPAPEEQTRIFPSPVPTPPRAPVNLLRRPNRAHDAIAEAMARRQAAREAHLAATGEAGAS